MGKEEELVEIKGREGNRAREGNKRSRSSDSLG